MHCVSAFLARCLAQELLKAEEFRIAVEVGDPDPFVILKVNAALPYVGQRDVASITTYLVLPVAFFIVYFLCQHDCRKAQKVVERI